MIQFRRCSFFVLMATLSLSCASCRNDKDDDQGQITTSRFSISKENVEFQKMPLMPSSWRPLYMPGISVTDKNEAKLDDIEILRFGFRDARNSNIFSDFTSHTHKSERTLDGKREINFYVQISQDHQIQAMPDTYRIELDIRDKVKGETHLIRGLKEFKRSDLDLKRKD